MKKIQLGEWWEHFMDRTTEPVVSPEECAERIASALRKCELAKLEIECEVTRQTVNGK